MPLELLELLELVEPVELEAVDVSDVSEPPQATSGARRREKNRGERVCERNMRFSCFCRPQTGVTGARKRAWSGPITIRPPAVAAALLPPVVGSVQGGVPESSCLLR